jgi:DNA-binding PadR family transcriptional regulator
MSLGCGILGYLSIKPLSGYDIKKLFDLSAAFFWPADQAQIYRSLKNLLDEGSVELIAESEGASNSRKEYCITDQGRRILHDWIVNPKESDFISRLPFIMQLFFSGTLSPEEQLRFLDEQIKMNHRVLQTLKDNFKNNREMFSKIPEISTDDRRFASAIYAHRWGVLRSEAYAKLLEEIKTEINEEIDSSNK